MSDIFVAFVLLSVLNGFLTLIIISTVKHEHKKTRKESQEIKTGDEWSKKREHEILKRLGRVEDKISTIWEK